MNYFDKLPDEIIEKIFFEIHKQKQNEINKSLESQFTIFDGSIYRIVSHEDNNNLILKGYKFICGQSPY